jgi:hypothetical protein
MILLYDKETAIVTLPKTGSTSLFHTLCKPPHNGIFCIGPSGNDTNYYDHHSIIFPQAPFVWKKIIIVRHPLQRLVSLWGHMAKSQLMKFEKITPIEDFVDGIANRVYEFYFYQWSQCDIIKDMQYDCFVKTENMSNHLLELGILHYPGELLHKNIFNVNKNNTTPPYEKILTPDMIEKLRWWWEPDAIRFDYNI